ncbi:MAG: hypothetical protein GKS00_21930 [Alphaproteobacteria bacterium]|nr:hypothetical protein [Alphaproteobacteria bacterium]
MRFEPNVVGETFTFQKAGKGVATSKARHGQVTPMNQNHSVATASMDDKYAGDWVDKLDESKLTINERRVIAQGGAFALGRAIDAQVIAVMDGVSSGQDVGDGTTVLTWALLLEAVEKLDDNDVPDDGQRWAALSPRSWSSALTIEEFASGDYVGDDLPFKDRNRVREWMGVKWMKHTGLTNKGIADTSNLVWHMSAVGFAMGVDITADITWHGDRAAHFVNHFYSGGAARIDEEGIVKLRTSDALAIPTT